METSEVLYTAADLVAFHGLGFGSQTWASHDNGICTEGAIAAAAGIPMLALDGLTVPNTSDLLACPAYRAVHTYLELPAKRELWRWNDEGDSRGEQVRTQAEVIETLRAAAVIEAAKEQQVVDGLAANGVVAAAVGAVSAS